MPVHGGSDSLKGFKADVTVTTVDFTIWHWSGAVSSDGLTSRGRHVRDDFSGEHSGLDTAAIHARFAN